MSIQQKEPEKSYVIHFWLNSVENSLNFTSLIGKCSLSISVFETTALLQVEKLKEKEPN